MPGLRRSPRSYLYVPGDSVEKLAKALSREADAVIVDLEDAIAPDSKTAARQAALEWLASIADGDQLGTEIWVRINSGGFGVEDLRAVFSPVLDGICVPKVHSAHDLAPVRQLLCDLAAKTPPRAGSVLLQPLIETASGVLSAEEIARVEGVQRLQLGEVDLGAELGVERSNDDREFLFARSHLVLACAAAGIDPPVGPVSVDFTDVERFRSGTLALKRLGFRSRACIHPAQVKVANEVFAPSSPEIERAHRLVRAFEQAVADGSGVLRDDNGAMVDEAVVRAARRLLEESGDEA
ncbi:MAG TPA: CoA ester lyase [Acidimicrobiales bacterium]|nr:CoA ester lyase [Acidimicrobiales bacterium]